MISGVSKVVVPVDDQERARAVGLSATVLKDGCVVARDGQLA